MFVGEQVMEQLCPGLVLVQYPGFVFLDDEIDNARDFAQIG